MSTREALDMMPIVEEESQQASDLLDGTHQLIAKINVARQDTPLYQSMLMASWHEGVRHVERYCYHRRATRQDGSRLAGNPGFVAQLIRVEHVLENTMTQLALAIFRAARDEGSKQGVYAAIEKLRPAKANERFAELAEKNSTEDLTDQEAAELSLLRNYFTRLQTIVDAALITLYTPAS